MGVFIFNILKLVFSPKQQPDITINLWNVLFGNEENKVRVYINTYYNIYFN